MTTAIEAMHKAVDDYHAHHDTCTKKWCALCEKLARQMNTAQQAAHDSLPKHRHDDSCFVTGEWWETAMSPTCPNPNSIN